jgi:hypothetical protein
MIAVFGAVGFILALMTLSDLGKPGAPSSLVVLVFFLAGGIAGFLMFWSGTARRPRTNPNLLRWMGPAALVGGTAGVLAFRLVSGDERTLLEGAGAGFILGTIAVLIVRIRGRREATSSHS